MALMISPAASRYLGYFTAPGQVDPVYDPGPDAPCPVCGDCLASREDVTTISLMWGDQRVLALFYRCHRRCYHALSREEADALDGRMLDLLKEPVP